LFALGFSPDSPATRRRHATQHTPHTIPIRQAFRMVWVLCNVGCLVALGCLPVGVGADSPATQRRHAIHKTRHIQHRFDKRFVWFGSCVMLVVLLHCVVCSWVFARQPSNPKATRNTQHTSHHIQHRIDRGFVWFGCCVMLVVLLTWVGCLWGFARQHNNPGATCNTPRTPHPTPNRQAFRMVWVLCSVGCVVALRCLLVGFRPTAQQPGGDMHHTTHTTYINASTGVVYGVGVA
jgi:hypothetical protein